MKSGFNLSAWAIQRTSLILFLVVLSAIAGIFAYVDLGRDEDPDFTFKTMIVSAGWPGGTIEQTLDQVTDRLEQTLQEVPNLDSLRSLTTAGQTVIYVTLDDATAPDLVGESWYQARKKVGDMVSSLPAGYVDLSSTMISATRSASSMVLPRTVSATGRCGTGPMRRAVVS